jgi:hypothetical protein
MDTFAVDKLMAETRRIATQYRANTGQTLPVSAELGRYDARKLLQLDLPTKPMRGIDFIATTGPFANKLVQVKSRVIFDEDRKGYRIGQLNLDASWEIVVLVLYGEDYQPFAIYATSKEEVIAAIEHRSSLHRQRGLMSLAKFKAISTLVWSQENGLEWDEIWSNSASA